MPEHQLCTYALTMTFPLRSYAIIVSHFARLASRDSPSNYPGLDDVLQQTKKVSLSTNCVILGC